MIAFVIVTIIGIICIVVSFLIVGKDNTSADVNAETEVTHHITDEYELNEEEVAILQKKVSDKITDDVNDIIYNADQSLSTMANEKMMALGDYAVTVCDEIEKNHKQVMFLYSMLGDKEKELKELVVSAEGKASELRKASDLALETYVAAEPIPEPEEHFEELDEDDGLLEEETIIEEDNTNDIILEMKRNGMSIMEIARQLGLGVGEVKLVVDLYQNKEEE